jgi:4-amino-4-deoxychorismate lyase
MKRQVDALGFLVNGESGGTLDPSDRGVAYGDGVFRTLLLKEGRPVCWDLHYRKLCSDCEAIALPCPPSETLVVELAAAAARRREAAGKIIVTRGVGLRGYAPPTHPEPTRIVSASPLPKYPNSFRDEGVQVHRCRLRLGVQSRLAGVKHLNRLENVLARMEWSDPAVAEGLLLDAEDHVIEGIATNLFLVREGVLHTPDLSRCGVSGVTRERIIHAAVRERVPLRVAAIPWQEIMRSEEVILVNSLIGAWQIRSLESRRWACGTWTSRIRDWLDGAKD